MDSARHLERSEQTESFCCSPGVPLAVRNLDTGQRDEPSRSGR